MAEITIWDEFGRAIAATIAAFRVRSVIEIGSWDGTGSTTVIMKCLDGVEGRRLTCVEANPERHAALARLTASRDWVTTVCSRSVSREAMTPKTFEEVWRSPYNRLHYPEQMVRQWWDEQPVGPGYLDTLTDETWDAALIDGCEFCGWDDYQMLRPRVRVLMLDDVFSAYKCAQADDELDMARRGHWSCIWRSAFVRNGASIWVRI